MSENNHQKNKVNDANEVKISGVKRTGDAGIPVDGRPVKRVQPNQGVRSSSPRPPQSAKQSKKVPAKKTSSEKVRISNTVIPFLIAVLITLVVVGSIALFILNKITADDDSSSSLLINEIYEPTDEDSHTILFIYDNKTETDPLSFMIFRSVPKNAETICIPVSPTTKAVTATMSGTVEDFYRTGGIIKTEDAIESVFDIKIDRYVILDSTGLQKVYDILGGVNFGVPDGVEGFTDYGNQYLSSSQVETLINYTSYIGGEEQRMLIIGSLFSSLLNQTNGSRLVEVIDSEFQGFVSAVDTDISALDYNNRKESIKYLLDKAYNSSTYRVPSGTTTADDKFVVENSFISRIPDWFYLTEENEDNSSSSTDES